MYPNFSYILHALIGTEPDTILPFVQTFGLFMALAFLTAATLLYLELKRKEAQGLFTPVDETIIIGEPATPLELILNGVIGFLVGFKILYIAQNFSEFSDDAASVLMSSKGSVLGGILGALIFAGYKYWEKNSEKLPKPQKKTLSILPSDRVGDITIVAAISGLFGAKIFALMETLDEFFKDPIGQLFSGSGLAIYGGLIGGTIGVIWYLKRKNIKVIHFADAIGPALIVSYAVGRIGCQLSGDGDWGIPAVGDLANPPAWLSWMPDWAWASDYPHNVNNDGPRMAGCEWRHCSRLPEKALATPIWEITVSLIIGAILWALRKRIVIPGVLFCLYLIFNGIERYWIEEYRVNDEYDWLPFNWTQAELIAVCLMLIGIGLGGYFWKKHRTDSSV